MICEDESLLAIDLQIALEAAGAEICALAASRADALVLLETLEPDAVILDVELNDGACADVAERLSARGIPFIVITAFDEPRQAPPAFAGVRWLLKPLDPDELVPAVADLLAAGGSCPAGSPSDDVTAGPR